MNQYHFPTQDALFLLDDVLAIDALFEKTGKKDINTELVTAILDEAAKSEQNYQVL